MSKQYHVIVVGAGHAGCEAALAAARMGCKTLLLTINHDSVAWMPCNPAIGGSGKSQVVAEIDALGGEIALNAEKALSQIQILNTSKGLALRSKRVQCDKWLYSQSMRSTIENEDLLDIYQTTVENLIIDNHKCIGVCDFLGESFFAEVIILTTGTYLKGRIHCGHTIYEGGRSTERPSNHLSEQLEQLGFFMRRFNTGTTPRIDKRTVNFSKLTRQEGFFEPIQFSFRSKRKQYSHQLAAFLGWTNEKTIKVTKKYLSYQPSSTGKMVNIGPRTCPSIEEKVKWFPDRMRHSFFLEQEGFCSNELYAAGLNMSIHRLGQEEILQTMEGLEHAKIIRPAYAIAYDFLDPSELNMNLETKKISHLFCAGQINGTTGYDEAAAQGLIAGINAVLKIRNQAPFILDRYQSYIGVMLDDMLNKRLDEPYRITPAHVEFRLINRADNADQRLTPLGRNLGLVNEDHYRIFCDKMEQLEKSRTILKETTLSPSRQTLELLSSFGFPPIQQHCSFFQLLKRPDYHHEHLDKISEAIASFPQEVKEILEIEAKYEGYIQREKNEIKNIQRLSSVRLPLDFPYKLVRNLSKEAQKVLSEEKPSSIHKASRLPGVTPADILSLITFLREQQTV